jgi:hypothetical protein
MASSARNSTSDDAGGFGVLARFGEQQPVHLNSHRTDAVFFCCTNDDPAVAATKIVDDIAFDFRHRASSTT